MLETLVGYLVGGLILLALAVVAALLRKVLRRAPFVAVAIGAAFLAGAIVVIQAMSGINYRTEGSPAGTLIFAVLGSVVVAAGFLGLLIAFRGFLLAGQAGSTQVLLSMGAFFLVLILGVHLGHQPSAGTPERAPPDKPKPPPTFRTGFSWVSISVDDTEIEHLAGAGTADTFDETLDGWIGTGTSNWLFHGLDCREAMVRDLPDRWCHTPGAFMRTLPFMFGLERNRVRLRGTQDECRITLPYLGRIATVSSKGACLSAQNMRALRIAAGVLQKAADEG